MSEYLKDLESLLHKSLGDDTIVERYVTGELLPPGENYGSKLLSVHAVIKRSDKEDPEDLYLVAKLPAPTQLQRDMFDTPFTFQKEIFMYSDILPFYEQLEKANGVNEPEISPRYYGSRLSLSSDVDFDDDAAILLDNLTPKGYYSTDKRRGCDLVHAKLIIKAMARFHALGMATKEKDPEFFGVLKKRSKCLDGKNGDQWGKMVQKQLQEIADDPEIGKFWEACVKTVESTDASVWTDPPEEPWSTIIHSDCWANNILFHKPDGSDEPDDIKFVDYQNYLFLSPARELTFFLGSGLDADTVPHAHELIDYYYDEVIRRLKALNCKVEMYSPESFREMVRRDGRVEFTHCLFMARLMNLDVDANDPESYAVENLFTRPNGKTYKERLRHVVKFFQGRGWLAQ
ncbi:uncharacterized LOC105268868 [Fopius arisanus]|uniref:Uncharacterized LOC105268868 n=1 Tax=Fopius arisanus TaxID=64838 RepID=A0AAR9IIF4_9HYME|nr:uncharacterized LOC105268868 [Fopius arisanus]KAG8362543.1 EcKinase 13 [Fopius arisanus]